MTSLQPHTEGTGTAGGVPEGSTSTPGEGSDSGRSANNQDPSSMQGPPRSYSPSRPPTSAEIDAVIAAAMANAPPAPLAPKEPAPEVINRSVTPLMTNLMPAAVGADGRVNLFVGNLPYRVRWQDLKDLFRKAGTVLRADVSLGPDNRSRGYGTVLMGSREDAARAIDRFNGYTWQTRTLEVRPDRLPPEYEPQPHHPPHIQHHNSARPPMYTYHNMSGPNHAPYSLPGHLTPSHGPAWLPGQLPPPRPPSNHMGGMMSLPPGAHPISLSPHIPQHVGYNGSSPVPTGNSPNTDPTNNDSSTTQLGSSPLAGSLTSGNENSTLAAVQAMNTGRRASLTPFSPDLPGSNPPRSTSPSVAAQEASRPASRRASKDVTPSPAKADVQHGSGRGSHPHPHPGSLGPLPPSMFSNVKAVVSPAESSSVSESQLGPSPTGALAPLPIAMEGLTHQGAHMGPPSTLHDRVVFVSNLPLTMQWQELKDLLRPAGVIIRADVATGPDGRPRGFGTALFASEQDASKAVTMFNNRDVNGNVINVHLERDSMFDHRHDSAHATPTHGLSPKHSPDDHTFDPRSHPHASLPWNLNTSMNGQSTPPRRGTRQFNSTSPTHHHSTYRPPHPGPLSMPPFRPLDTPGSHPYSPPLQTRGLPPMTPSMPGFVFNAYPETPPLHPHFLSPGAGPFSPGIPVSSPSAFQFNPYMNAAPGAPVSQHPSHAQGGSAALGTPTTQSFPPNAAHGFGPPGAGAPGGPVPRRTQAMGDYFPPIGSIGSIGSTGNEPISPISSFPTLSSRVNPSPSPLNAKDRLASNTRPKSNLNGDSLLPATEGLTLNEPGSPSKSTSQTDKQNGSSDTAAPTAQEDRTDVVNGDTPTPEQERKRKDSAPISRMSMEERRPNLSIWDPTERRASFGDIVAGRSTTK